MLKKKAATACKKHPEMRAAWYCKKCKMYMCEECSKTHDEFFGNEKHIIMQAASLTSFDLLSEECPDHPGCQLNLICKDCDGIFFFTYINAYICYFV